MYHSTPSQFDASALLGGLSLHSQPQGAPLNGAVHFGAAPGQGGPTPGPKPGPTADGLAQGQALLRLLQGGAQQPPPSQQQQQPGGQHAYGGGGLGNQQRGPPPGFPPAAGGAHPASHPHLQTLLPQQDGVGPPGPLPHQPQPLGVPSLESQQQLQQYPQQPLPSLFGSSASIWSTRPDVGPASSLQPGGPALAGAPPGAASGPANTAAPDLWGQPSIWSAPQPGGPPPPLPLHPPLGPPMHQQLPPQQQQQQPFQGPVPFNPLSAFLGSLAAGPQQQQQQPHQPHQPLPPQFGGLPMPLFPQPPRPLPPPNGGPSLGALYSVLSNPPAQHGQQLHPGSGGPPPALGLPGVHPGFHAPRPLQQAASVEQQEAAALLQRADLGAAGAAAGAAAATAAVLAAAEAAAGAAAAGGGSSATSRPQQGQHQAPKVVRGPPTKAASGRGSKVQEGRENRCVRLCLAWPADRWEPALVPAWAPAAATVLLAPPCAASSAGWLLP